MPNPNPKQTTVLDLYWHAIPLALGVVLLIVGLIFNSTEVKLLSLLAIFFGTGLFLLIQYQRMNPPRS